nr:folliculin [Leptinotarsa decemlineata]
MDVTVALGHFCDKHGPCVLLCTEKSKDIPKEQILSQSLVCSACESLPPDTVFTCQDEHYCYITSRASLNTNVAHTLKDVVLRSLSIEVVEEKGKKSGTIYFGDDTRGHIISHVFNIRDSLARGFRRKFCIVVLGNHQIPLLNHYNFIEDNLRHISEELQQKADNSTSAEETTAYRRDFEQFQNASKVQLRPLPQLVNEHNVFAHLHMWFVFLLRAKIYRNVPHSVPQCPVECSSVNMLRELGKEMPENVFQTILYCTLTGITVTECNTDILKHFRQLLPKKFALPASGKSCEVFKTDNVWSCKFDATFPINIPRLISSIEVAVKNPDISDTTLSYHLMDLIMHWFSNACVLSWATNSCDELMRLLEIRKCDLPLLAYWIPQSGGCVEMCTTDWFKKFADGKSSESN